MNERFTPHNERTDQQELVRLQNNYRRYELLMRQQDIRAAGGAWYRRLFNHGIDFARVFNHLATTPSDERDFRDLIHYVVEAQLGFQRQVETLKRHVNEQEHTLDVPEKALSDFEDASNRLKKIQSRYIQGTSNGSRPISQSEITRQSREAERVFVELWEKVKNTPPVPWPYDEITLPKEKRTTKLQKEEGVARASAAGQPEENSGESEEQPRETSGESEKGQGSDSSGGGGDGSGGGSEADDMPEPEREPFEFHPEMLRTVTGRTKVFKEMVRMYNDVRKKRDALGFGEERDAEGALVHKAYRNVKDVDFDGFQAFRRRYAMLKKLIADYSARSIVLDAEGKTDAVNIETELSQEEMDAFEKGFGFLKAYYGRTERFKEEGAEGRTGAADEEPTIDPEPQPEPERAAAEPEPELPPEPEPDPTPTPEPEPTPTPEAERPKEYIERMKIRNQWREKKEIYERAYDAFLQSEKERKSTLSGKLAFWKRAQQPLELQRAEQEYNQARALYAHSLDEALGFRIQGVSAENSEHNYAPEERITGLRAALANRFVLGAAHDKLRIEKEYLPKDSPSLRVFEDLQKSLKKHRYLVRAGGYAIVAGIGLATGGVAAAVVALAGKQLQMKLSAVMIAGGATVGAAVGNDISESIIAYQEKRRDSAMQKAQRSFSVESLQKLENAYLKGYRGHERAVRGKKFVIGAGALAGGALGAAAAGSFDELADMPELPAEPEIPAEPEEPVIIVPEEPEEEPSAPEIEEEPIPEEPIPEEPEPEPIPEPEEPQPQEPELEEPIPEPEEPKLEEPEPEPIPEEPQIPDEIKEDDPIQDEPAVVEEPDEPKEEEQDTPEVSELLFTFESGSKVDTVSEALFESWKEDHSLIEDELTKKEFLAEMYSAIAEIEKNPALNAELMEQMGITSGDIDKVQVGQTINLQPFFEYLNNK